jgi:ADP-ribosylglycohydrolase
MSYVNIPDFQALTAQITEYARLRREYGAAGVQTVLDEAERTLEGCISKLQALPVDAAMAAREPNEYEKILALRPEGPRGLWTKFNEAVYAEKLEGALLARLAGCTLGTIVEFWKRESMEEWAAYIGDAFPPADYWSKARNPIEKRYQTGLAWQSTRDGMDGVPVDDDIMYTLLGLLICEEYGADFTTDDVGKAWLKYLPYACTAEEVALKNLKAGVPALKAADVGNPYEQWIGADIRSDGFAYIAAGQPEKAAKMAYRDAFLSHRRNGIYGEMFFAAAQAAAFAVDNAADALKIGLTEIPENCSLAKEILWALDESKNVHDYKAAHAAVTERFRGMSGVHANLNACLTVFGLMIGAGGVTKTISETVAMGYDNDCTAATAGSVAGAIAGKKGVSPHWSRNFNNKVRSYLIGHEIFYIDDLLARFTAQARKAFALYRQST